MESQHVIVPFSLTALLVIGLVLSSHPTKAQEDSHDDHLDLSFLDFFSDDNTDDEKHLEEHIREDFGLDNISVENMTESEKEWYYFKLHDYNNDYKLDGLELLKAWQHHYMEHVGTEHYDHTTGENAAEIMQKQYDMFIDMVDMILKEQDVNLDGYLDYFEYILAKKKEELAANTRQEEERKKAQ